MSMTVIPMGINKAAREFLDKHEYKIVGQYLATQNLYKSYYGNIYEVVLHSIKYEEDDPRYWFHPVDDIHTYAEVYQNTEIQYGNTAYDYYCLRDITNGELSFKWEQKDMEVLDY